MAYNNEFYAKYKAYLLEPIVRRSHDLMFNQLHDFIGKNPSFVMDLGCGTCEFKTYSYYSRYAGIDLQKADDNVFIADFTKVPPSELINLIGFSPSIFISLFAIEPTLEYTKRYALYERLFREVPSIHFGLVSGFFYRNKAHNTTVKEYGDIISYQTIEEQSEVISPLFMEFRCYLDVPSKFFGDHVVEVWKILKRRGINASY